MNPVDRLAGMAAAATVMVAPETLRDARLYAGASIAQAARACDHDDADVDSWEQGNADPPLAALRDLAALYAIPLTAFLLETFPPLPRRPPDLRTFAGVAKPEATLELTRALNRASALQTLSGELLGELDVTLPDHPTAQPGDAEEVAAGQRTTLGVSLDAQRKWGNPWTALRGWRNAIEQRGVFTLQLPIAGGEVKAFSLSGEPPVIVLNQSDFVRSRVFSVMHEYAHVLLGSGAICIPGSGRKAMEQSPEIERFCNRFAGAILVPGPALRQNALAQELGRVTSVPDEATLERLAAQFHVSWAVVWYRLRHLGLISHAMFAKKFEDWDSYPTPPPGRPARTHGQRTLSTYGAGLSSLVLFAAEKSVITTADAAQYLTFPASHIGDVQAELSQRTA
jgi:Zn-dependent peptidase ImmA (M78 family)